jgi:hypothetical protein
VYFDTLAITRISQNIMGEHLVCSLPMGCKLQFIKRVLKSIFFYTKMSWARRNCAFLLPGPKCVRWQFSFGRLM